MGYRMEILEKKLTKAKKIIKEATGLLDWEPSRALLYKIEDAIMEAIKILCSQRRP